MLCRHIVTLMLTIDGVEVVEDRQGLAKPVKTIVEKSCGLT